MNVILNYEFLVLSCGFPALRPGRPSRLGSFGGSSVPAMVSQVFLESDFVQDGAPLRLGSFGIFLKLSIAWISQT